MGCKPWRQSYVGASSRTHPSLSLIDFPFCTGQWVPAYKPLCKCFRISKPHTSLISTSSATYCPNDLSTLLFTRIPRMGSLYLPSALASFFFFFWLLPFPLPPWWSSLLSTPAGLPLELLPSLSKAETGSWINLSGTCPPKASLLGEPLGHSKDSKEDSSCLPLEWLIYFPLAFISHQREYPCRRSMRMSKLWIQNILKLPLLQDVYLETIVWVPHFSITIFYFKHTLKFKLGPRQC